MDSDKVLVLSQGHVGEFDAPDRLLRDEHGIFRSMIDATGPETSAQLSRMAAEAAATRGSDAPAKGDAAAE